MADKVSVDMIPDEFNRFKVQIYLCDMDADNPVNEAYAIGCPDKKSAQLLYDTMQRMLQVLTYKPLTNG